MTETRGIEYQNLMSEAQRGRAATKKEKQIYHRGAEYAEENSKF
jgi:hypothetical protein